MNNTDATPVTLDISRASFTVGARFEAGATVYVSRTLETTFGHVELYFADSAPKADAVGSKWGDPDLETDIVCEYLGGFTVKDLVIDPYGRDRALLVQAA
ncbi:hypothetical protein ACPPVQ_10810 [Diaminobutyricibacter sp. McL0618]|uniref:hypothetical protein n=1 Tax=Leifsonia sp. McL0618 TaxID=3415677 RepID=UPI003CEABD99